MQENKPLPKEKSVEELKKAYPWLTLIDMCKNIGENLCFTPTIEYVVGKENSIIFNPSSLGNLTSYEQKKECESFLEDKKTRFPNSWVISDGYGVMKLVWYPFFFQDWEAIMEGYRRVFLAGINDIQVPIEISNAFLQLHEISKNRILLLEDILTSSPNDQQAI